MEHRYLLIAKSNKNETVLSYGMNIAVLMNKAKYLSFDYYRPSQFYIKDMVDNRLLRLWMSKELGCMLCEVDNEVPQVTEVRDKNGARSLGQVASYR